MAIVRPFRAVRYNSDKVDLSQVISPPYDIISSQKQQELHERSPYNFTRVDFPRPEPGKDPYTEAAGRFCRWLKEQVLVRDPRPAVYLYRQQYAVKGEKKVRFGFLALLKLEDGGAAVHGHEHTHAAAKEDRFKLISKVNADLSPIFVVFEDRKRLMEQNLKACAQGSPVIDVTDEDRIAHTVWRVEDPAVLEKVSVKLSGEDVFIADGHHRYEVACAYRDARRAACPSFTGEEDFNYVMAYFTNARQQGLTILPIHRIVRLDRQTDWEKLTEGLSGSFSVEEVKHRERFQFLIQKAGQREHAIGLYGGGKCLLLRLKNIRFLDKTMGDRSREYRELDVAMLNTLVFGNVLGIEPQRDAAAIRYTADADEAMAAADEDARTLAFLMNPTRIEQIISVAANGEKMPPKSTYFYPKVESGLAVFSMDGEC